MNTKHTPAPIWYTKEELFHWLISENYSREISEELSDKFAASLQSSFEKGFEKGSQVSKSAPELLEALKNVREYMTAHIPEKVFDLVDNAIKKATD